VATTLGQVMVTSGTQQAFDVITRVLLVPGQRRT
jgi:DNA-binding transcriptional MocR family regulator